MPRKDEIIKSICETLEDSGYISAYRYDHFRESEAVPPPFAVYRRTAAGNMSADGVVYHHGGGVDLELYAEDPDSMAEIMEHVETLLDGQRLYYELTADTVYIESEEMYESLYEL